ncbi:MAG: hypothetical protein KJ906_00610 [Nanoarchaeota archaeon]|nr:hypothetical protein [Nanoarchaeota archaeon]
MRKILPIFVLVLIIFVSGCTGDNATGNVILEDENKIDITYKDGTCRQDTDCLIAHCGETEDYYCMNSIQVETQMKCYQYKTKMVAEKDYEICGCVQGICSTQ